MQNLTATTGEKLTLQQLVSSLKEQNLFKKDMVIQSGNLSFENGKLAISNPGGNDSLRELLQGSGIAIEAEEGDKIILDPLDQFHAQISEKLKIPRAYYDRMNGAHLPLRDLNVNHWLQKSDPVNYLVRMFIDAREETGFARALLSDRFNIIDNYDVLFATLEAVKQAGVNLQVDTADITEKKMYVRFICPDIEIQSPELLKNYRVPKGSPEQGNPGIISGFVISNSEVGAGQFSISPRAVVLACKNGMIRKDDAFNKIHLGAKMEQFTTVKWSEDTRQKNYELILSQVKDAVKTFCSPEYLGGWISDIIAKGNEELKHPTDAVKNACRFLYLPEEREADILNYFIKGADTTGFGITQALTYYAGQDATADERFELESGAVAVLDNLKTIDRPAVQQRAKKALSGFNPSQN